MLCHLRPFLHSLNELNISQANLYQQLNFMGRSYKERTLFIFSDSTAKATHGYLANFSENKYFREKYSLNST